MGNKLLTNGGVMLLEDNYIVGIDKGIMSAIWTYLVPSLSSGVEAQFIIFHACASETSFSKGKTLQKL